jgi:hypothetical protein
VINLLGTDLEELFKGRAGELRGDGLVWRDQAILWGLHVARVMSTVQIAVELFPGQQACKARTRLNRLRGMGLVERHRGGRSTGSEPYLWSLTRRGFERLRSAWRPIIGDKGDPIPWLLGAKAKFNPWGWAERPWGSALPGRVRHDLAALDFLISYRRAVDAALAGQAPGSHVVSEWRAEHVFLAPLAEPDGNGERFPMTVSGAVDRAFDRYHEPTTARGFEDRASLQMVKPDAALSLVVVDHGGRLWTTIAQLPPWERERVFPEDYPHHLVVDVLIEFDRTGRVSDNLEKLRGLDMFLNVGRRLVHENPVVCLGDSYLHEGYTADVVVLFVCPPGRAITMMRGADEILTGHLWRDGEVSYEGRNRILFCESDAFGNLTADLADRERWLRLPAGRRPAPPKAREGSRRMWLLPELPPGRRETSEMLPRVWEDPEMIAVLRPDESDELPF